jgi:tungstate transport system ATP-binding protein
MLRRSVAENLAYPLALAGKTKVKIKQAVQEWAERIDLSDALDRAATRLSGGEKQKLALARALINAPDVLFLDEPCTNLDGRATREIEALLTAAHAKGTSVIIATHDLGQAKRLGHHVVFLLGGKIHETGPAAACFDAPQTPALQAFLKGDIVE